MDRDQELSLLALVEWETRLEAWLRLPEADRASLVRMLAELMVRQADREMGDESAVADHVRSS